MERSLLKQVNRTSMTARLSSKAVKPVYFPNFFGVLKKTTLTWETLTGEKGAPVIADIISYDATSPQKKREVIGKLSGDIPKTSISRKMIESQYNEYLGMMNTNNGDENVKEILNLVFADQDFCYNGVRGRFEWMCMQFMSQGGFVLDSSNNNGIVTEQFVGCGMPDTNKKVSSADWASSATADGLQDIEDVLAAASAAGTTLQYVIMRSSDFTLLKKQTAVINKIKNWISTTAKVVVTLPVINDYLASQEIPVKIVLVNPSVRIEQPNGTRTTVNPFTEKRICFLEDLMIGDIQHGPIAAEQAESYNKVAVTVKKDFVFMSKWSELRPFGEWTQAEANAFPVINDPTAMYILKADGSAWSSDSTEATDVE